LEMGMKLTSFHANQNGSAEMFLAQAGDNFSLLV